MNAERQTVDVLAVLDTPPHRIIKAHDWKFDHNAPVFEMSAAVSRAPVSQQAPMKVAPVYKTSVFIKAERTRMAVVDADKLDEVRDAIAELIRTQKQLLAAASWSATRRIPFAVDARGIVEAREALRRVSP